MEFRESSTRETEVETVLKKEDNRTIGKSVFYTFLQKWRKDNVGNCTKTGVRIGQKDDCDIAVRRDPYVDFRRTNFFTLGKEKETLLPNEIGIAGIVPWRNGLIGIIIPVTVVISHFPLKGIEGIGRQRKSEERERNGRVLLWKTLAIRTFGRQNDIHVKIDLVRDEVIGKSNVGNYCTKDWQVAKEVSLPKEIGIRRVTSN